MAFKLHNELRAATADLEKAVLQNAVTATETLRPATINALVYEFVGLRNSNKLWNFWYGGASR